MNKSIINVFHKTKTSYKKIIKSIIARYLPLLLLLVSSNCDEDNVDSDYEEIMLEDGCNINLTKVGTFSNVSGILMSTGSQIDPFVIEPRI
jgi:hypothetical protein